MLGGVRFPRAKAKGCTSMSDKNICYCDCTFGCFCGMWNNISRGVATADCRRALNFERNVAFYAWILQDLKLVWICAGRLAKLMAYAGTSIHSKFMWRKAMNDFGCSFHFHG